jgi:hypothetical protein
MAMNAKTPAEAKLTETLVALEQSLLSPLISGELRQWTRNVQERAATLSVDITTFLRTVLHVQYADIARNAPELSNQLSKLTEADGIILGQVAKFLEQLHHFGAVIDKADPQKRETMLETHRKKTVEIGLALIMAIRKQQADANTWFEEAQFRDLGVGAD